MLTSVILSLKKTEGFLYSVPTSNTVCKVFIISKYRMSDLHGYVMVIIMICSLLFFSDLCALYLYGGYYFVGFFVNFSLFAMI